MNGLALDTVSECISFAACSGKKKALLSLDTGMHQSEKLLAGIQEVLNHCNIQPQNLDYAVLCSGPGSFTGLRLAFSALKALSFAFACPVYAIPTLEAIALPFFAWKGALIPVIDAKKNRFYAAVYRSGSLQAEPMDAQLEDILKYVDTEESVFAAGPDAEYFMEQVLVARPAQNIHCLPLIGGGSALSLLELGKKKIAAREKGLQDYAGPVYIRKSEAEVFKEGS